jgi:hypothetical protein
MAGPPPEILQLPEFSIPRQRPRAALSSNPTNPWFFSIPSFLTMVSAAAVLGLLAAAPAAVLAGAVSVRDDGEYSLREVGARNTLVRTPTGPNPRLSRLFYQRDDLVDWYFCRTGASGSKRTATPSPSGTTSRSTPIPTTSPSSTSIQRSPDGPTARLRQSATSPSVRELQWFLFSAAVSLTNTALQTPYSTMIRMTSPASSTASGLIRRTPSTTDPSRRRGRTVTSITKSVVCLVTMTLWMLLRLAPSSKLRACSGNGQQ